MSLQIQGDRQIYRLRRTPDGTLVGSSRYETADGSFVGTGNATFVDIEALEERVDAWRYRGADVVVEIDGNRV